MVLTFLVSLSVCGGACTSFVTASKSRQGKSTVVFQAPSESASECERGGIRKGKVQRENECSGAPGRLLSCTH